MSSNQHHSNPKCAQTDVSGFFSLVAQIPKDNTNLNHPWIRGHFHGVRYYKQQHTVPWSSYSSPMESLHNAPTAGSLRFRHRLPSRTGPPWFAEPWEVQCRRKGSCVPSEVGGNTKRGFFTARLVAHPMCTTTSLGISASKCSMPVSQVHSQTGTAYYVASRTMDTISISVLQGFKTEQDLEKAFSDSACPLCARGASSSHRRNNGRGAS